MSEAVKNPITEGKIGKEMLLFFFPILSGSLFQQIYNAVDAMIVGKYLGKVALSAVGASSGMIVMLIVGFFVGLSSGAGVLAAQYFGAQDEKNVSKTVHTVIVFSLICGTAITIVGYILSPQFMVWMKVPEETMELSVIYLRVYFLGMIGNLFYNVGAGILRAVGDSKRPFYFLVVSCFLNILLDFLFIMGLQMGVFGAALATILSQAVSALLVLAVMLKEKTAYHISMSELRMDGRILSNIIRIGLPAGLQSIMYGISNIIIQVAVNGLGTDYVAAWATYYKIDGVYWMSISAFGIVGATFVGQNLGAGRLDRVKRSFVVNLMQAVIASVLISVTVYLICPWLFPLFSNDPSVNEIGVAMMRWLTRFYVTYASIEVLSGVLRGAGDTFVPMMICAIGVCVLRSIWILMVMPLHNDMYTMMMSYPISWVVSSIAFYIYLFKFSKLKTILQGV